MAFFNNEDLKKGGLFINVLISIVSKGHLHKPSVDRAVVSKTPFEWRLEPEGRVNFPREDPTGGRHRFP